MFSILFTLVINKICKAKWVYQVCRFKITFKLSVFGILCSALPRSLLFLFFSYVFFYRPLLLPLPCMVVGICNIIYVVVVVPTSWRFQYVRLFGNFGRVASEFLFIEPRGKKNQLKNLDENKKSIIVDDIKSLIFWAKWNWEQGGGEIVKMS